MNLGSLVGTIHELSSIASEGEALRTCHVHSAHSQAVHVHAES